jgi:membrane protein YdbS with pleckstrin-like domain
MAEDPTNRLSGAPRLIERVAVVEGIAVLLLAAVGMVVFGLASHQTWPVVIGAILLVLVVLDAVILTLVRRRAR